MRRYRPAGAEVIDHVGHYRIGVTVAADPPRAFVVLGNAIAAMAVLFFEAPRPQLVAASHPDIVAGVKVHGDRALARDRVGLIGEAGPAGLITTIILCRSAEAERSQNKCDARSCHQREWRHHSCSSHLQWWHAAALAFGSAKRGDD